MLKLKKMSPLKLMHCLYLNLSLFIVGLFGIVLNRKNLLVTLMSIEILLLSVSLNFVIGSIFFNDVTGEVFVIFILAVAASESAIALAIIAALCRYRTPLEIRPIKNIKK
jgi:NADH-quinone oxidoreductase subunit K